MALGESFAGVLEAARVGAEWAWHALYADTAPDLLRYARASRVSDPEDVVVGVCRRAVDPGCHELSRRHPVAEPSQQRRRGDDDHEGHVEDVDRQE